MANYIDDLNRFESDLEGGTHVESDCEGDPPGVKDELRKVVKGENERTFAALTTGSFSAYVRLPQILSSPLQR